MDALGRRLGSYTLPATASSALDTGRGVARTTSSLQWPGSRGGGGGGGGTRATRSASLASQLPLPSSPAPSAPLPPHLHHDANGSQAGSARSVVTASDVSNNTGGGALRPAPATQPLLSGAHADGAAAAAGPVGSHGAGTASRGRRRAPAAGDGQATDGPGGSEQVVAARGGSAEAERVGAEAPGTAVLVQCEACDKWRVLPRGTQASVPLRPWERTAPLGSTARCSVAALRVLRLGAPRWTRRRRGSATCTPTRAWRRAPRPRRTSRPSRTLQRCFSSVKRWNTLTPTGFARPGSADSARTDRVRQPAFTACQNGAMQSPGYLPDDEPHNAEHHEANVDHFFHVRRRVALGCKATGATHARLLAHASTSRHRPAPRKACTLRHHHPVRQAGRRVPWRAPPGCPVHCARVSAGAVVLLQGGAGPAAGAAQGAGAPAAGKPAHRAARR